MLWLKKIFASLSSKERLLFVFWVIVLLASGIALLAFLGARFTKIVPARGGDYTEGALGQPSYINPLLAETAIDKGLVRLAFASLPELAEKIEPDRAGRSFRVRLKEGLLWSDGTKLTSDDVIFTLQNLQDPQTASPYFSNWQGVVASRVSELELQLDLASPYAFFEASLNNFFVLPKHIFADTPSSNWKLSDYNLKPVGSGPYVFNAYEKRGDGFITSYSLKPNKNYAGDKAYIENVIFDFFTKPEDLLKNFNNGQVDGISDLEPGALSQIQRTFNATSFALPNYYAVFLNQSQNLALQDAPVRRALSLAIDRDRLVKESLLSYGEKETGPVPSILPNEEINQPSLDFNPDAAAVMLDAAGWRVGENGVRVKTIKNASLPLNFSLTVPNIPFLVSTAKILVENWTKIGAQADLNILSPEDVLGGPIKNRSYQAVLFGNLLNQNGDLFAFWHSSQKYYPGLNLALYGDKNTDKLLENIRQNGDIIARLAQVQQLSNAISKTDPAIFLYSPSYIFVSNKNVYGASPSFLGDASDRLRGLKNWYVKVARTLK